MKKTAREVRLEQQVKALADRLAIAACVAKDYLDLSRDGEDIGAEHLLAMMLVSVSKRRDDRTEVYRKMGMYKDALACIRETLREPKVEQEKAPA